MSKLIQKIGLLALMVLASYVLILFGTPKDRAGYYASFATKLDRLIEVKPPRLILIGGSNIAMGIDSGLLEKLLGVRPVNMGINGGVGLRFVLEKIKPQLRAGDRVVIVPEYEQMTNIFNGDINLDKLIEVYPQGLLQLTSYKQYLNILYHIPLLVQMHVNDLIQSLKHSPIDQIYNGKAYNQYGDIISHLGKISRRDISIERILKRGYQEIDKDAVCILNRFYKYAQKRNVTVYMTFPCLTEYAYYASQSAIEDIYQCIKSHLYIPIISQPVEDVYPSKYFYDTVYHLNSEGRKMRTERLAKRLMARLL